jgi:hypothetical protein
MKFPMVSRSALEGQRSGERSGRVPCIVCRTVQEPCRHGTARIAAHKILGEDPHFGGKHSVEVIQQGIKTLEELKRPMPPARPKASAWVDVDLGPPAETLKRGSGERRRSDGFSQSDLRELRKAIKAKDTKRIAELTAKLGKPSFKE